MDDAEREAKVDELVRRVDELLGGSMKPRELILTAAIMTAVVLELESWREAMKSTT